jgi:hypothetical protein
VTALHELAKGLKALGLAVKLEARDRQLVLIPDGPLPDLAGGDIRRRILEIARAAEFTHVSIELRESSTDAPLHRSQPL